MTAPARRHLRHRRRRGVTVKLTERDGAVLHALARFRLARTLDLVAYAFAGARRDTAAVRLRCLFDGRFLTVLPPEQGEENVYRLGPAGKVHLAADGVAPGRVPRGGLEHHLAIVETWVAVAGLAGLELERALPDWELREQFSPSELHVVPDLFLLVRVGEYRHAVAVEVDRGTESMVVLNRKLEAYRSLWGQAPGLFGYDLFGVAVVCHAPARRAHLAAALKKVWVVPHVLWTCGEDPKAALCKLFDDLQDPLCPPLTARGDAMRDEAKRCAAAEAQGTVPVAVPATPTTRQRESQQLLTLKQVAEFLQVSTKTVRRLRIPCLHIGRAIRYRPSDVERFLAARRFHA